MDFDDKIWKAESCVNPFSVQGNVEAYRICSKQFPVRRKKKNLKVNHLSFTNTTEHLAVRLERSCRDVNIFHYWSETPFLIKLIDRSCKKDKVLTKKHTHTH